MFLRMVGKHVLGSGGIQRYSTHVLRNRFMPQVHEVLGQLLKNDNHAGGPIM